MQDIEVTKPFASTALYRAVSRWHFYAGLFVLPFLLILSLSGALMLLSKPIEQLLNQQLLTVTPPPSAATLPASKLLAKVQQSYPDAKVKLYIPAATIQASAQFVLQTATAEHHAGHGSASTLVYQNPYSGQILGTIDPEQSWYSIFKELHSTLFIGDIGDALIEIAAGFAVLMLLTGLYMAWPRQSWREFLLDKVPTTREDWRRLHRLLGLVLCIPLLLFLLSGLAWTNLWGGKLVQAWSSLSINKFDPAKGSANHDSMAQKGVHPIPWVLEQSPLPHSSSHGSDHSTQSTAAFTLDAVTQVAKRQGFSNYRIHFPKDTTGVWTISATTIAGDITNPLAERTLHLHQGNGAILADIGFADYPLLGMAMSTFIPFHQGELGLWNWLLAFVLVLLVLLLISSGFVSWWKRRPKHQLKLAPPAAPAKTNTAVILIMLIIALFFPLSAAVLILIITLDWLWISRWGWLRSVLK